jgi:hypothetical protein
VNILKISFIVIPSLLLIDFKIVYSLYSSSNITFKLSGKGQRSCTLVGCSEWFNHVYQCQCPL